MQATCSALPTNALVPLARLQSFPRSSGALRPQHTVRLVHLLRRGSCLCTQAGRDDPRSTGNAALDGVLAAGRGFVDSAAALVPDSVPRPVAKGGVAVVGAALAFWLLQKLVSTVLTIALLGGAAWLYFQYGGSDASSSSSSSSRNGQNRGKRSSADDADDPLAEARRIMDKYK